jgi:hypothetical protein
MMKNLLEKDFVSHYSLSKYTPVNTISTTDDTFDLVDDAKLLYPFDKGIAKYDNPNKKEVNIINYETFFKSLPYLFQQGKKNCDLIVYTSDKQHFLLNELTDTNKGKGSKRTHAIKQMQQVLQDLSSVAKINSFIQAHSIKRCCYFNKKAQRPSNSIRAIDAFSRQPEIPKHGSKMLTNVEIDSFLSTLEFELWEYSGNQTYSLKI